MTPAAFQRYLDRLFAGYAYEDETPVPYVAPAKRRVPWAERRQDAFRVGRRQSTHTALTRFDSRPATGERGPASLRADHPALAEARTIFPSTVVPAAQSPRLLVSGRNNPKLGDRIRKGAWRGMPLYHLTLEERATCPRSCAVWDACYGNGMHMARRHAHGPALEEHLARELHRLGAEHPEGFVVRLHTLGDFYSDAYALRWLAWLGAIPALRIFGFTAWTRDSMRGALLEDLNRRWPDRCAIRFSVARPTGRRGEAITLWDGAAAPAGVVVCPAQTGGTACCATCGFCWAPAAQPRPVAFIGHGLIGRGRS